METKLEDKDVREIASMQHKIDTYELFITTLSYMVKFNRTDFNYPAPYNVPLLNDMNRIWRFVKTNLDDKAQNNATKGK